MKQCKRFLCLLLTLTLLLGVLPMAAFAAEAETGTGTVVNSDTVWTYYDQETDPVEGTDYAIYNVRTIWTYGVFLDSEDWKQAAGPFGAKNGKIADLGGGCTPKTPLNQYKENGDDIECYFFVTTFTVEDLSQYQQLTGSLYYDDCAIVYLNHSKIASFDEPEGGFSKNMEYGGSNASAPKLGEFTVTDMNLLQEGVNVLAVELHQGRASSSDIYLDFQNLTLSTEAPEIETPDLAQDTIALSLGADETEMNVAWYAPTEEAGRVSYAPAGELVDGQLPASAQTVTAEVKDTGRLGWYSHQAVMTGLEPDTVYAYQLTNAREDETVASQVNTFTTGGGETTRFLFVGDPQLGSSGNLASDEQGWETTLEKAAAQFPEATFLLSAGDQVDAAANETQYQSYLNHGVLASLPQATTIGNHDSSSNAYDRHFHAANESETYGVTNAGGDSWFVYNNILFMVLNSNDLSTAEHKAFMQEAIAENPGVSWKIVMFHHSIYSVASHAVDSDILQRRDELAPVFKELDIDVVLMGHDHVYTRSYLMDGLTPMTDAALYDDADYSSITDPTGILYVTANSASGSKYYNISGQYEYAAVQNQEKVPNVSYVEMDDSHFTITTYRTSDMTVVDTFTIYRTEEAAPAKLLIDQVYGGGGKGDTPIANSFVELYNPNEQAVDLRGYTLTCGGETLELTGTIPAGGSFLVTGKAEETSDEYLTYDLPEADQTWDLAINNKNYTVELQYNGIAVDSVTANEDVAAVKVSKQKSLQRVDHADTDTNDDFRINVWEKGELTITADVLAQYAPHNSKGEYGSLRGEAPETPAISINTESDTGFVTYVGSYATGVTNADGGVAEIVAYNSDNQCMYLVSGYTQTLDIVRVNQDGSTSFLSSVDVKALGEANGFDAGDITSVTVSTSRKQVAIAVQHSDYDKNGAIVLLDYDGNFLMKFGAGCQPDMITFTPDSRYLLTANEGEPRQGYGAGTVDPKGSVTVVDLETQTVETIDFTGLDGSREALVADGVLLKTGAAPSADLEPEYIAVSADSKTAYVTLQENNAIAALDLTNGQWKYVKGLGFKDHSQAGSGLDLNKDGTVNIQPENVYGVYMPDGIAVAEIDGKEYLLTANEGDAREWGGYANTDSMKINGSEKKVEYLLPEETDGLDADKIYLLGARSFSIWDAETLALVYDSGDQFEQITARVFPEYFNSGHDEAGLDTRSNKKGPEPESVAVLTYEDRTYAVIGLERMGGILLYDVTDPANAQYADYLNVRGFDPENQTDLSCLGDLGPEGICTVPAALSPTGRILILVANEVSGTVTLCQLPEEESKEEPEPEPTPDPEPVTPTKPASSGTAAKTEPEPETVSFQDVSRSDWFYEDVLAVCEAGLMTGTGSNRFSPALTTTRAMVVTMLYRLAGEPAVSGSSGFDDVTDGAYYAKAVTWAVQNGIANGVGGGRFAPDQTVTRQELAAFLYRYAQVRGDDLSRLDDLSAFPDQPDGWAVTAMQWAVGNGIVNGISGRLEPRGSATRAQLAAMFHRFLTVL